MLNLFKQIIKIKILRRNLLKFFVFINNYSYNKISKIASATCNGIHPKHDIMNYHQFFIDNVKSTNTILDVGFGNGFLSYDVSKKAKKVVGIELVKSNYTKAINRYKNNNLSFILGDATKYKFNDKFDYIILSNVLEHIDDRIIFLKKLSKIAPNFLIRVPLITRSWLPIYLKDQKCEYRLDKTHRIEYTEENFKEEIKQSGLKLVNYEIKFGEIWAIIKK